MMGILGSAFRDYARSYRYAAPLLVYAILILFIYGIVPNPVMPSYSLTASLLFLVAAWLGFGYVDAEDETQRLVGILHSGGWIKYELARGLLPLIVCAILAAATTAYPILFDKFDRVPDTWEIVSGFVGHAGLAVLGIAISYLFTHRLVPKLGFAISGLFLSATLSFAETGIREALPEQAGGLIRLLPPVFPLIEAFNRYETVGNAHKAAVLLGPFLYALALFGVYLGLMIRNRR